MIYALARNWPCSVSEVESLSVNEFYSRIAYLRIVAQEQEDRRNGQ